MDSRFVLLLVISIAANFAFGEMIRRSRRRPVAARAALFGAICANLAALAYFKYFGAVVGFLINHGLPLPAPGAIALPLGISFFTFTQIAYLVDVARGESVERDPVAYALFVTLFPHLIAGPILHHGEMMPQFKETQKRSSTARILSSG